MGLGSTQPLAEMSTSNLPAGEGLPASQCIRLTYCLHIQGRIFLMQMSAPMRKILTNSQSMLAHSVTLLAHILALTILNFCRKNYYSE
jgi:hypothetical protein